ncbi:MAG TPA: hypothetical protein VM223_06210 [Planctomycetota bacterium]|nr:hypothetical protein [Planctomycetota bacterium]
MLNQGMNRPKAGDVSRPGWGTCDRCGADAVAEIIHPDPQDLCPPCFKQLLTDDRIKRNANKCVRCNRFPRTKPLAICRVCAGPEPVYRKAIR